MGIAREANRRTGAHAIHPCGSPWVRQGDQRFATTQLSVASDLRMVALSVLRCVVLGSLLLPRAFAAPVCNLGCDDKGGDCQCPALCWKCLIEYGVTDALPND